MTKQVYTELASLVDAYHRCIETGNDWAATHEATIKAIVGEHMPSGSGFDCGTNLDLDASSGEKLVFFTSYHHMNEGGFYDGWSDHTVTVKPSLIHGFTMTIGGRDRNGFKEYAYDLFDSCLRETL